VPANPVTKRLILHATSNAKDRRVTASNDNSKGPVPHFSSAADNNKDAILDRLRTVLAAGDHVLEIASGTAQHALHFARHLPNVVWQPSDRDLVEYSLAETIRSTSLDNLRPPLTLDVSAWPDAIGPFNAVYSANCIHVMPHKYLRPYVEGAGSVLKEGGAIVLYGPFRFGGEFTTPSNAQFDTFLRETYPGGGIRDFEEVEALAKASGLTFESNTDMPANNQFMVFRKMSAS